MAAGMGRAPAAATAAAGPMAGMALVGTGAGTRARGAAGPRRPPTARPLRSMGRRRPRISRRPRPRMQAAAATAVQRATPRRNRMERPRRVVAMARRCPATVVGVVGTGHPSRRTAPRQRRVMGQATGLRAERRPMGVAATNTTAASINIAAHARVARLVEGGGGQLRSERLRLHGHRTTGCRPCIHAWLWRHLPRGARACGGRRADTILRPRPHATTTAGCCVRAHTHTHLQTSLHISTPGGPTAAYLFT
mmetsp:Transcript_17289/g.56554  ORF Transcript_17289/g.56554 Transcript_17289/m.56554 type:complete len:251 (-) Transcript_17289:40-792(-)